MKKMIDEYNTIEEIEARIQDLKIHQMMWRKAGGVGPNMALKAEIELQDLEIKKQDILNGTNNYEIIKKEREIKRLKNLRNKAIIFQKRKYGKKIAAIEKELEKIKTK